MLVGQYCNKEVVVVRRDESIENAARTMRQRHVGSLVVVDEGDAQRRPVGIVTDRDLVIEVLAQNVDMDAIVVGDVMSNDPVTAAESEDLASVMARMHAEGVRRMPVVDEEGRLTGIVAVDDLINFVASQLTDMVGLVIRQQDREQNVRN